MELPMVEEDGVVVVAVVVEEDIKIEDLNLFQKNLRLQHLSVDFHQIRFKEILIWSSKTLRYNFIDIEADKTTRHFAMFVISRVDSLQHVDNLRAMTSPWCRKSNKSKKVKLCSGYSKLWSEVWSTLILLRAKNLVVILLRGFLPDDACFPVV